MTCYITHATTVDKTALRERERTCLRNHLPAERMAAKRLRNCPEQKIRRELNKYKEKKTCWKKLRRKKKKNGVERARGLPWPTFGAGILEEQSVAHTTIVAVTCCCHVLKAPTPAR